MVNVTMPAEWVTVGVPDPRLLPPTRLAETNEAPAGTGTLIFTLVRFWMVWPPPEVGMGIGSGVSESWKVLPWPAVSGATDVIPESIVDVEVWPSAVP